MSDPITPFSLVGTYTISGTTFTFNKNYGVTSFVLKYVSGTVTILGTANVNGLTNTAQTLDSDGFIATGNNAIDGFVVDATAGVCILYVVK